MRELFGSVPLQKPFMEQRELEGVQKVLAGLPKAALFAGALVMVATTAGLGYAAGARAPGAPPAPRRTSRNVAALWQRPCGAGSVAGAESGRRRGARRRPDRARQTMGAS